MTDLKIVGTQAVPSGVRLHFDDDGETRFCDLTPQQSADLAVTLLRDLNRTVGGARFPVTAEGLDIPVGTDRPGQPQPVRVRTTQGLFILLDLSWSAARKLQDLVEGLLRASPDHPGRPS